MSPSDRRLPLGIAVVERLVSPLVGGFHGGASGLGDLRERAHQRVAAGEASWRVALWYWRCAWSLAAHYGARTVGSLVRRRPRTSPSSWRERMGYLVTDIRLAIRALRRAPTFFAVVVLTLALGIGANSAIFSVVQTVILRPLPYTDPGELAAIWMEFRRDVNAPGFEIPASEPEFVEFREATRVFGGVAGYWTRAANIGGIERPVRVPTAAVTANFLTVLGVRPVMGRGFAAGEDGPGADRVAILSHRLWRSAFGGEEVLGRSVLIDGASHEIVGVLPPAFRFPDGDVDLLRLSVIDPANLSGRASHYLAMVGRLRDGVTHELAARETTQLMNQWAGDYPGRHGGSPRHPVVLRPLRDRMLGDARPAMWLLSGAALLVLLIACANVANLMFARSEDRAREVAVRRALGASRGRVVAQVLTESAVVAVVGGILGLGVAWIGVPWLAAMGPADVPRLADAGVDTAVLTFTLALSIVTGLAFGAGPAVAVSRGESRLVESQGHSASAGRMRMRQALVVGEVSVALILVVGAGLVVKSLGRLRSVDPGFDSSGVVTLDLSLRGSRYESQQAVAAFHERLDEQLAALPGVTASGAIRSLPLRATPGVESMILTGAAGGPDDASDAAGSWNAQFQVAGPGYFAALAIPLVAGRFFTPADRLDAPPVTVINRAMADRFWPEGDAIGNTVRLGGGNSSNPVMTVVGVVGNVRQSSLSSDPAPQVFAPRAQAGVVYGGFATRFATLVVRSTASPAATMDAVRAEIRQLDRDLPVANVQRMETVVASSISDRRFVGVLLSLFSGVALLLGAIGIYGLMSFLVARRSREIGIRMALGAQRHTMVRMVVVRSAALAAAGLAAGVLVALAASRVVAGFLYSVGPRDPVVFLAAPVMLLAAAVLAAYLPARRAANVDPLIAIRSE